MKTVVTGLVLVLSALVGMPLAAEPTCSESIRLTSPDEVFAVDDKGTATHQTTGLMWSRCSLGQTWTGTGCEGEATLLTWAEALTAAAVHVDAGYADWRLPNKNELEFIVEEACSLPCVNQRIFPDTLPLFYWTSSPYAGSPQGAWSVDFAYGVVSATVKTGKLPVRLVRDVVW